MKLKSSVISHTTTVEFIERPESRTVQEGTNATFNCSINNTDFGIHWFANGTDILYTGLEGFEPIDTNMTTFGQLEVNAFLKYNNTTVTCVAIDRIEINKYIICGSDPAFLIVVGKYVLHMYLARE